MTVRTRPLMGRDAMGPQCVLQAIGPPLFGRSIQLRRERRNGACRHDYAHDDGGDGVAHGLPSTSGALPRVYTAEAKTGFLRAKLCAKTRSLFSAYLERKRYFLA